MVVHRVNGNPLDGFLIDSFSSSLLSTFRLEQQIGGVPRKYHGVCHAVVLEGLLDDEGSVGSRLAPGTRFTRLTLTQN